MKLQAKDNIIYRLMLSLKRENMFISTKDEIDDYLLNINKGWIESLEWVLNIEKGTIRVNYGQYTKDDIINAVDIAVGDDGLRSKEVIAILEEENNERLD
tara:strand:- start:243 stop:542 length:300 start_codon:yes stop_codon:yes gene_type:complete